MLSIVIPIHNEERVILSLYDRLTAVLEKLDRTYEIIFVDDASTDQGFDLLANLVETDSHLKVLRLRRKFGQTTALAAGFDAAKGETVVSLDGDLQQDMGDIPLLLKKIEEGYDIASGWRKNEIDARGARGIAPHFANWLMKRVAGVSMHDFGATWRAYRAEILKDVNLYGELHRFIPVLANFYGARIAEVRIQDRKRPQSAARYHPGKMLGAFFDIVTSKFLLRYLARPMHSVGKWGVPLVVLGSLLFAALSIETLLSGQDILAQHMLSLFAGAMLWFAGLMLFCVGLIGEVLMRAYFESQGRRIYTVREIRARRERVADGAR